MLEAQQISETLEEKKLTANEEIEDDIKSVVTTASSTMIAPVPARSPKKTTSSTIKKTSGLPPKKPSSLPPRPNTTKGLKNTPIRKRSTSPGSASICSSLAAASTVSKMSSSRGLKKNRSSGIQKVQARNARASSLPKASSSVSSRSVRARTMPSESSSVVSMRSARSKSSSVARGGPPVPRRRLKLPINNE